MRDILPYLAGSLELALVLGGAVLLWRFVLRSAARAQPVPAALPPWPALLTDLLTFLLLVVGGSFLAAIAASTGGKYLPLRGDEVTVLNGAAAQLGMLAGVIAYRILIDRPAPAESPPTNGYWLSGAATFLLSLPVVIAAAKIWEFLLELAGLPVDKQDLIGMFANAESPWLLGVMITLAIFIAPLTEELVFRAGLFRYLRTRVPRWVALLGPALFFAALHVNWKTLQGLSSLAPLLVLAVIFSLAYERTGRIGTSVVAHALFNLNTILLIFSGLGL